MDFLICTAKNLILNSRIQIATCQIWLNTMPGQVGASIWQIVAMRWCFWMGMITRSMLWRMKAVPILELCHIQALPPDILWNDRRQMKIQMIAVLILLIKQHQIRKPKYQLNHRCRSQKLSPTFLFRCLLTPCVWNKAKVVQPKSA